MPLTEALEMAVRTDPGKLRPHNEDAVFCDATLGLAILADNPTRLVVQRFDNPDRHDQLRKSANSINRLH